jgi:PAS domain S-box-containing protein
MNMGPNQIESKCLRLRQQAERYLAELKEARPLTDGTEDMQRLLHELQVHQIELDIQNENLRTASQQLETALERYTDLYDFAPVGYLTLAPSGLILEINLTGAKMLGEKRPEIIGRFFLNYLDPRHSELLRRHLREAFRKKSRISDELSIKRKKSTARDILLVSVVSEEHGVCRSIMTDVSQRKQMIQKLRVLTAELRTVEARERRNLANELHDNLSQIMAVANIKLSQFPRNGMDDSQAQILLEVNNLLEKAMKSMHALAFRLNPPELDHFGLSAALQKLAEEFKNQYDFEVRLVDAAREKLLPKELNLILYRTVRELLMNAVKHAQVRTAEVVTRRIGNQVLVTVSDKGKGFDNGVLANGLHAKGFGLFSIKDQFDHLGGSMAIYTCPNGGTQVTVALPLSETLGDRWEPSK